MQHSSGSTEDDATTPEEAAGQALRRLRTARNWSQEHVAERMKAYGYDWHQTLIGRIEAAQRPLRLNEAVDLASLFGVPLDTLATRAAPDADVEVLRELAQEAEMRVARFQQERTAAERSMRTAQNQLRATESDCQRAEAQLAGAREEAAGLRSRLAAAEGRKG